MYLAIFTDNIWSYLLWSPVLLIVVVDVIAVLAIASVNQYCLHPTTCSTPSARSDSEYYSSS